MKITGARGRNSTRLRAVGSGPSVWIIVPATGVLRSSPVATPGSENSCCRRSVTAHARRQARHALSAVRFSLAARFLSISSRRNLKGKEPQAQGGCRNMRSATLLALVVPRRRRRSDCVGPTVSRQRYASPTQKLGAPQPTSRQRSRRAAHQCTPLLRADGNGRSRMKPRR